jgi:DNA-binding response OmpR family regulator
MPITEEYEPTILLIDDEPLITEVVRGHVTDRGFHFQAAPNGEEGLRLAASEPPDLILLDLRMPGLNGCEVLARLKQNPATNHLPVLFFSACDALEEKLRAFQLGAVDYITKPVDEEELMVRIQLHLRISLGEKTQARRLEAYEQRYGTLADDGAPDTPPQLSAPRARKIRQLRNYLESHLSSPFSLDQLAAHLATNPKSLNRDFQILYGVTVYAWLRERRLLRAAELLRTTDITITQISENTGFSSSAHLTNAFKTRFQIIPSQYRATHRATHRGASSEQGD